MTSSVERLKKRAGFERLTREGHRCATTTLVMQGALRTLSARMKPEAMEDNLRIGFTTSKKLGNAVVRNRIRRRLKEAARQVFENRARAGADYVIIGRPQAEEAPFEDILKDMRFAVDTLHRFFNKAGQNLKNNKR